MKSREDDQMNEIEEDLRDSLHKYLVKYPDDHQINKTIDALRSYVPEKQKTKTPTYEQLYGLLKQMATEISIVNKSYWLISLFLYVIGYFIATYTAHNYLLMLIIITPLPFIFGLFEVFKSRESGVLELEMACKFSAYQIMLSRLLLVSLYNIGLSLVLILLVSKNLAISVWGILFIWLAPFTIFAAMTLWISMQFKHVSFIVLVIASWIVFSASILVYEPLANLLIDRSMIKQVFLMILGVSLCYQQIKSLKIKYVYFDGVDSIETSD